ncbi:hypothetical protein CSKR_104685 [Clonorchis sinensis]|uniref:Uncharacterized protein n=1 Tax=Clonorchis sinensis TaxID=79923 RepID=A0A419PLR6_CLOSI|nr:hypothetical protein CSKR_104685 [Clonorchis sinensis]
MLYQTASCFSWYDIRDIAIHAYTEYTNYKSTTRHQDHHRYHTFRITCALAEPTKHGLATNDQRNGCEAVHDRNVTIGCVGRTSELPYLAIKLTKTWELRLSEDPKIGLWNIFHQPSVSSPSCYYCARGEIAQWLEREFTDRKVRGSNPTTASRLPLSRLGQPGSIPALVLPTGGTTVRHRKGDTAERLLCQLSITFLSQNRFSSFD